MDENLKVTHFRHRHMRIWVFIHNFFLLLLMLLLLPTNCILFNIDSIRMMNKCIVQSVDCSVCVLSNSKFKKKLSQNRFFACERLFSFILFANWIITSILHYTVYSIQWQQNVIQRNRPNIWNTYIKHTCMHVIYVSRASKSRNLPIFYTFSLSRAARVWWSA